MPHHPIIESVLSQIKTDDSKVLGLTLGGRNVLPGETIPKGESQALPILSWNALPGQKFLIIALDLDAPFPSFAPLSPVLHWLQPGFAPEPSRHDHRLSSSDPAIAFWTGPGPPAISSPHRYVFLLYDQPADFDAGKFTKARGFGIRERVRWDLAGFEQRAGLGRVVAGTYFFST